jgi:D-alanyl-lipoteichoic acid acyltransferase DltB (MBOAT superfamily)
MYILLILLSTSIDYFLCRFLTGSDFRKKQVTGLTLSILMNLGLLFTFKYYNFFQDALSDLMSAFGIEYAGPKSKWLLPVGISFYTFQTLSYSIDVFRKNISPERHFGKFALFVAFFPQLVAGPIERASNLLVQFNKKLRLNVDLIYDGLILFLWGLFKKVVVADNLRILADHYFDNSTYQTGGGILIGLVAFTVQIYADFSGYSDMAIGAAKLFGIDLNINFRTPYFSKSITEFWRRWHITLSFWLRDYVFIPLGGSRRGLGKTAINLFIVFLIAGIWHGAEWTFILWGAIHGILVVIERLVGWDSGVKSKGIGFLRILFTFALIVLTMLPVRAENMVHLFELSNKLISTSLHEIYIAIAENIAMPGAIGLIVLFLVDLIFAQKTILDIKKRHSSIRFIWAITLVVLILFLGDNNAEAFFYFQF